MSVCRMVISHFHCTLYLVLHIEVVQLLATWPSETIVCEKNVD